MKPKLSPIGLRIRSAAFVALLALVPACATPRPYTGFDAGLGGSSTAGSSGHAGASGATGGTSGSGGSPAPGTGGGGAEGGNRGMAGGPGAGGSVASTGGAPMNPGGNSGSGGGVSTGGMLGSGGAGTASGSGGRPASAGGSGSGGTVGTGGKVGTGGVSGSGGLTCQPKARDCTSSLDNDCNGTSDNLENAYCKCTPGAAQSCGNSGQPAIGTCKAGTQACELSVDKPTADCGSCSGVVTPKSRDCTSSADNDCNGIDDTQETPFCTCKVGTAQPCQGNSTSPATGICKYGTQSCTASGDKTTSNWEMSCVGSVGPNTRDCTSTADNDCNGMPDDQDCYGTIVVPGTVSCWASGGGAVVRCSTADGCTNGICGTSSAPGLIGCDGPNDCSSGQLCCTVTGPSGTHARSVAVNCPASLPYQVCDPSTPTSCAAGQTCATNAAPVYWCR